MKLFLGNRNYSSWSLRGWLAAKQSGLAFEEVILPLYGEGWEEERQTNQHLAPSHGKVPVLWDEGAAGGGAVVWDSLAIVEHLADKVGQDRYWPSGAAARGLARSLVAEMHSGYAALRQQCPMNIRARVAEHRIDAAARADTVRILTLWAEARARFGDGGENGGGPWLFGSFCAADIFYAPIATRFVTYGFTLPGFARAYVEAVFAHPWMQEWIGGAEAEQWVIEQFEVAPR